MKKFFLLSLLAATVLLFTTCSKDSGGGGGGGGSLNCSTVTNKSFSADVNPIVQSTCNQPGCHNAGSLNGPGPLTNYTEIFNARISVRSAIASGSMPKNTTLTTSQKNSFLCWIDSGAPNN
jgi:hypothetical protein